MDVDNDTDLDLFVTEHNGLEPYGQNFLSQNQVEMNMNTVKRAMFEVRRRRVWA